MSSARTMILTAVSEGGEACGHGSTAGEDGEGGGVAHVQGRRVARA
ncbi:MAG: hypothetical protein WCC41_14660 [Rhodomicrobium sp.]